MLPAPHRLTDAASFRQTTRRGHRASGQFVVAYLLDPDADAERPARVGFVVAKTVGNAVTRNRVRRRLRHLVRAELDALPGSATLVVRALPAAAGASSGDLGEDLARCLARCLGRSRVGSA